MDLFERRTPRELCSKGWSGRTKHQNHQRFVVFGDECAEPWRSAGVALCAKRSEAKCQWRFTIYESFGAVIRELEPGTL